MNKRRICVITGTRAEYGLLYWLMREIKEDPELELLVIATGMHLSPEFGLTYKYIENDGFKIDEKIEILLSSDTPSSISKSIGLGLIGFSEAFERIKPDLVVILGDRFEIFAAAQAAMIAKIPIAHIHGGEATEGLIDEPIRNAITKLSHFHFAAAEPYRRRIIQMGEAPKRVWNFGAPALDNFERLVLLDRENFQREIKLDLNKSTFLITYHPVTLSQDDPSKPFSQLLAALECFPESKIIFTKANADTSGRIINSLIDEYAEKNKDRVRAYSSMGQVLYLSALKHVCAVIGNSSSGLIEAPCIPVPSINIGDRQRGRLKAKSVIDCKEDKKEIIEAIKKATSSNFIKSLRNLKSPYGNAGASRKIKETLKTTSLTGVIMKKFHDIEVT